MNKDFNYWLGWITCIIVGVLFTPIYAILIATIRIGSVLIEIIWDTFTFMPKAVYEYERASLKSYWEKEKERLFKDIKKD
jgi:hypothetical protein